MNRVYVWGAIVAVAAISTIGDVLLSRAMKQVGDLGELRKTAGLWIVIERILQTPSFLLGICTLALGFFSLLVGLSWGDLSLVVPASASLTFVLNAIAAKFFLHERVDHRRWMAALLVAGGVALLAM
jgi:drug/metabolite transporter (DMT)-like permease